MKRLVLIWIASLCVCLAHAKTLNVIATVESLASIVRMVGGNHVNVTTLVVGSRDPHRIEAKPSYMSAAARADLWVGIGLDLEIGYEEPIISGSANGRITPGSSGNVHVGDWVPVREKPAGEVTRAMGDIHPYGNPHVWLDPYNVRIIGLRLAERMAELDPQDAAEFRSNSKNLALRLDKAMFGDALASKISGDKLWEWDNHDQLIEKLRESKVENLLGGWCQKMRPFWKTKVVTYHRSWTYFAARFGLNVVGELEPKPGIDPTPAHVTTIIKLIQESGVKLILQEPFYSTRNAQFVSQRTGIPYLVLPGNVGQSPAATDIISLFDELVNRISEALRK
jgi:ABC-type Zn uptake system ZnuABC Zn-binding protein ZnuA